MEIAILLVSLLVTLGLIYAVGRINDSHEGLIRLYKNSESLIGIHFVLGLNLWFIFSATLAAINNTFWHLPYMF